MLTHLHCVPTQMLLRKSIIVRAWWDITPQWHRLWVGLFGHSRFLLQTIHLVTSLLSGEPKSLSRLRQMSCWISAVVKNSQQCEVSKFISCIILGKTSELFSLCKPLTIWKVLGLAFEVHKLLPVAVRNKYLCVFFRACFCAEENRMDCRPVVLYLNTIPAHTVTFFLPSETNWRNHAILDVLGGFCIFRTSAHWLLCWGSSVLLSLAGNLNIVRYIATEQWSGNSK